MIYQAVPSVYLITLIYTSISDLQPSTAIVNQIAGQCGMQAKSICTYDGIKVGCSTAMQAM